MHGRNSLLIIAGLLVGSAGSLHAASVVRLPAQVQVTSASPTLDEVLDLSGADAVTVERLEGAPLFADTPIDGPLDVSLSQIRTRLAAQGVNMANVLLRGATRCRVTVLSAPAVTSTPTPAPTDAAEPGQLSLAEVIRRTLEQELQNEGGTLELQFGRAAAPYVDLTTPPYEFDVRRKDRRALGLREFEVAIRRDGKLQRTVPIFVRVQLVKEVLVARAPLNIGGFVKPEDLEREKRVFDRLGEVGLDTVGAAVGQQVGKYVPAGAMIHAGDLKPVDLVRRSRPVHVIGGSNGIETRLSGYALDAGTFGETIRVRIGDRRENYREIRGVVTGIGTVRMVSH